MKINVTRDFDCRSSTFRVEVDDSELEGYFDAGFQNPYPGIVDPHVDVLERLLAMARDSIEARRA